MTGSTLLDIGLVLLVVLYGWNGWRQGFVAALLGLVGLVAGAVIALRVVPGLLEDHTSIHQGTFPGAVVLVVAVLVLASLGQGVMLLLASRLRSTVKARSARTLDSALGMVAVVVAAVLVIWVVAGAVRTAGPTALRQAVANSRVVGAIDAVVPPGAGRLVDSVTQALDSQGFPKVFEGLGPEPIRSVGTPDPALVADPAVRRAIGSVIHIRGSAPRCGQTQVGSGWVVADGRVVTNAHVVAGTSSLRVSVDGRGEEYPARVVAIDPARDVAVLSVPALRAAPLAQGEALEPGAGAVVAGFPGDDGLSVGAARVRGVLQATGADIYGRPGVSREIYSLRATIRKGASGGPMLDAQGRVVGMVFATSLDDPQTGYALTLRELMPVVERGLGSDREVSTGACAVG